MATILSLKNIRKSYGRIKALKNVSFDVPGGSVYGILGPNGSGKTTLLGIVMDVLQARRRKLYLVRKSAIRISKKGNRIVAGNA